MAIRPRRSVLYMPGSNPRALEKAKSLPADALILDLEDAVAPDAKESARRLVCNAVQSGGYGERELVIRVNAAGTEWGADDLRAAAEAAPDAILLPKVSSRDDVLRVAEGVERSGTGPRTKIWAMMETPRAMLDGLSIASAAEDAGSRLAVFVMGTNDLAKETRARLVPGRTPMLPWLVACIAAARSFGLDILDGVFNDLDDEAGFRAECLQGRDIGMDGKTLIHPKQIGPCNEIFSPTPAEIEWARKILAAFEESDNARVGVIRVEGQMVERLHLDMARRIVALGEAHGL